MQGFIMPAQDGRKKEPFTRYPPQRGDRKHRAILPPSLDCLGWATEREGGATLGHMHDSKSGGFY